MATEPRPKNSIFPDLPREMPVLDKDGRFAPLWSLGLSSLFQALQRNFKNEGIVIPPLSQANMDTIQALYAAYVGGEYNTLTRNLPDISGQTAYNLTTNITNQFVIAIDGSTPALVTLAAWIPFAMLIPYAGNPNSLSGPPVVPGLAGVLNWLCYDTVDMELFICTTSGGTGVPNLPTPAVWTMI